MSAKTSKPTLTFTKTKSFFVGIDSDGCVFDTMGLKHRECFCPAFIGVFNLQPLSGVARQVWEFVNLHSQWRGSNRFKALRTCFELLAQHPHHARWDAYLPDSTPLSEWLDQTAQCDENNLSLYNEQAQNAFLQQVIEWSRAVNAAVARISRNTPPFTAVKACLERMADKADLLVVSQTPYEAIAREWAEHGISDYITDIAAQEHGSKSEHLALAAAGNYPSDHILMIGDAPGDLEAATSCGGLFFPILPDHEEESWQELLDQGIDRFFAGALRGAYSEELQHRFMASLPADPPWGSG